MKKVLLFPYHPDVELLARRMSLLKGASIIGVYSFREDESVIKDINGKLGCTGIFEEMLKQCDTVLLLDNYRKYKTNKYHDVVKAAIAAGKQVLVTPLAEQDLNFGVYNENYDVLRGLSEFDRTETNEYAEAARYTIETPIISVFGMGKHCGKFENQILLKSILDREGYTSVWISSNPLGILFGSYAMPDFLYDKNLAFEEKVIRFNHFVYRISTVKNPDVIVIGVPEGISEFTVQEYNHFAEYPLVIGSAVPVDSAILCLYFVPELDIRGVESLKCHCRERFGFPVNMYSVGRTAFERVEGDKYITYLSLEEEYLKKYYQDAESQSEVCVGIWELKQVELAMHGMLCSLAGNPDAI